MKTMFVLCRDPLPRRRDGWRLAVGAVQVEPELLSEAEEALAKGVTTLRLSSPTFAGALVAEAVGEVVARCTRGLLIEELGLAVVADYTEAPPSPAALERELDELLHAAADQALREANDWSDVALGAEAA